MSLRDLNTFSSFRNPVYRLFYGAMMGQQAALNMQMMTGSLLLYRLAGSATALGILALAWAIPMLFLSLFGGVIADRAQKKFVLIIDQGCAALVALGVALSLTSGFMSFERPGSWWVLIGAGVLNGTILGLMMPSRQAIIREIVSNEQLMNAVALNTMGMNLLRMVAPAAAGFLIDAFDFKAVYFTMFALNLLGLLFVCFLPRTSPAPLHRRNAFIDIMEGLKYIRHETAILFVMVFSLFIGLLSMPYMILLPIFTEDILKVGAKGLGMLQSVSSIGAISGSVVFASLPNKKRGVMLLVSALVLGLALTGFSFSSVWLLSLGMMVFVGLGQTGRMTLGNTLIQYYVKDEYRGRVMSIMMMEIGLSSFGTFVASQIAEKTGAPWALGGLAMGLAVLAVLALAFLPRVRRLD